MDYNKTLNLPDKSFPLKADPSEIESRIIDIWGTLDVYERRQRLNEKNSGFLLHNQPILADSHVLIDDALSMILKDIVLKYKLMRGFHVPHFPVWNCCAPVSEFGKRDEIKPSKIYKQYQALCLEYVESQKEKLRRLGIFAYWDKAILTSDPKYRAKVVDAFGDLYKANYVRKASRSVLWCISCQADLAENEIQYKDYKLLSLYVKFPVIHGLEELGTDVYIVVWTNTPWTLPANTAIAVHPDYEYVAVKTESREILVLADDVVKKTIGKKCKVVKKMKGLELEKVVYANPLLDRDSEVILDRNVSPDRGTGCIHTLTRHNQFKSEAVRQRNPIIPPILDRGGRLTEEAGQFCGINAFESSELISLELEKRGCLLTSKQVEQPYPHCLYCNRPIIVRTADIWVFNLNANGVRERTFQEMETVDWLPDWRINRISSAIANRSDWGISRHRIWGIPAPVFYCERCNFQVDALESIEASRNLISKRGFNRWLATSPNNILSEDVVCSRCGGRNFHWEADMLDGEFVSAMSYKFASNNRDTWQNADICLGGDAQNEGWFQLSFLLSMAVEGSPPFRIALLHGNVLDEDGKRIPKSEDGDLFSQKFLGAFGADVLRLWSTSMDCKKYLKISQARLEQVSKAHRRIRNILRFLLSNLSDYDPVSDKVDYVRLQGIDQWALHRLTKAIDGMTKALESYQFHVFYRLLNNFCSIDISSLYLNIAKRRLYVLPRWSSSRRAVQTVIYEILTTVTRMMAPVAPFAAEEVWGYIPGVGKDSPSVYLSKWPDVNEEFLNDQLETEWNRLLDIRSEVYKALEVFRKEEGIRSLYQASVALYANASDVYELLDEYIDELETIFKASKVRLMPPDISTPEGIWLSNSIEGLAIEIRHTTGEKCERCRIYSDTVGTNEEYPTLCYRCIGILEGGADYI